ncbi:MAG: class D sortase [Oscillospiraceae bacterium]|nr:class D sortase [Oscillospiraceae bacterium]
MNTETKKNKTRLTPKKLAITLAVLIILTGFGIAVYPYAKTLYYEYQQRDLMNKWQLKIAGIGYQNSNKDSQNSQTVPVSETSANSGVNGVNGGDLNDDGVLEGDVNAPFNVTYALNNMVGTLKIPSIDFTSPILKGDTPDNLNIGVCEVAGSTTMGGIGNYIIAGHYSKIRGRHFNRLPEIQIGASVFISDGFNTYEYKVYEILHVKAGDAPAISSDLKERTATLITCDYAVNPIGRVIVKCEMD